MLPVHDSQPNSSPHERGHLQLRYRVQHGVQHEQKGGQRCQPKVALRVCEEVGVIGHEIQESGAREEGDGRFRPYKHQAAFG